MKGEKVNEGYEDIEKPKGIIFFSLYHQNLFVCSQTERAKIKIYHNESMIIRRLHGASCDCLPSPCCAALAKVPAMLMTLEFNEICIKWRLY